MKDPLQGISTENLEKRIEMLMGEIEPSDGPGFNGVSFGVNVKEWHHLCAAISEYIRMHRNVRFGTPDAMKLTPVHLPVEKENGVS